MLAGSGAAHARAKKALRWKKDLTPKREKVPGGMGAGLVSAERQRMSCWVTA